LAEVANRLQLGPEISFIWAFGRLGSFIWARGRYNLGHIPASVAIRDYTQALLVDSVCSAYR